MDCLSNICNYCDKNFSSIHALRYHQKNTTYCLEIQGKLNNKIYCSFCNKNFSNKNNLTRHSKKCIFKIEKDTLTLEKDKLILEKDKLILEKKIKDSLIEEKRMIKEKEMLQKQIELQRELFNELKDYYVEEIHVLQNKLENIAIKGVEKPTITSINKNNTITNTSKSTINKSIYYDRMPVLDDLTQEYINKQFNEHFTKSYLCLGQKGVAQFVKNYLLETEDGLYLYCTDVSRNMYKIKDKNGNIINDLKAKKLIDKIANPLHKKTNMIISDTDYLQTFQKQIINVYKIPLQTTQFLSELSELTNINSNGVLKPLETELVRN